MSGMDRRRFVQLSAAASAAAVVKARGMGPSGRARLKVHADRPGPRVPANFVGLSYETEQLADAGYFDAANVGLVEQFRGLAERGALRFGGNTSDYGYWRPTPGSQPPARRERAFRVGDPPPHLSYAVTPEAVRALRGFLDATGWTCLYGINLGNNTPELAAAEAEFVAATLGERLEYFQVGNEADRFGATIRSPELTGHPWTAEAYLEEWLGFARAIVAKVPGARFGLPDVASNVEWVAAVGERLAKDPMRAHVACVSHHYYVGGPPSNPEMTIGRILTADPRVGRDAAVVLAAAARLQSGARMTEGNTCYRGGKPGVSDVFAAALWSADYLLRLASMGYAGVNLHGGEGQMVANSLGGRLPGDEMVLAGQGSLAEHPRPYYTPIAHMGERYVLQPVGYGMRFAGLLAGARMVPVEFDPGPVNATAYAAERADGSLVLAVINKDATQAVELGGEKSWVGVERLSGAGLGSRSAELVAEVGAVAGRESRPNVVPPATAMLLRPVEL